MSNTIIIPDNDLPDWMRLARRGWDWGLFLVIVFALLAAWPFLLQPGLPRTNASENYVFLGANYDQALREGHFYSRWASASLGGYGAPIPHYYPPLAPYTAGLISTLFTNNPVDGVRITYILAYIIAATTLYLFVKRHTNAAASLLTVICYIFSPYFANVAPHIQGNLPITLMMGLLPALLWAVDRLIILNKAYDLFLTALIVAALILTHPFSAFTGLLLALVLSLYITGSPAAAGHWSLFGMAVVIGILASAFFWFPALAEYDMVNWYSRGPLRTQVLTVKALITPPQPVDLNALIPGTQFSLGLPLIILTPLGLIISVLRQHSRVFLWFFGLSGLVTTIIATSLLEEQTWLLAPITLCAAIVASGTMYLRDYLQPTTSRLFLSVLIMSVLAFARQSWLAPRWSEIFGETNDLQQILYEQQGSGIAVLPPDARIPSTISPNTPVNRLLISGYQSGNINKIAPLSASPNTQINVISHQTQSDHFQIRLNSPTRLNVFTAFFPGWKANMLDRILPLSRDSTNGLINIDAPAMNGELFLTLTATPVRQTAWIISGLAVVWVGILTWWRERKPQLLSLDFQLLTVAESRLIFVCVICFVAVLLLFATPSSPFSLHLPPGHGLDQAFSLRSRTQNGMEAIAYRLNRQNFSPGETVELTLYWQTIRPLPNNYRIQVYLQSVDQGTRWHRTALYTPGDYPTSRWRRYMYVPDRYDIPLSPTIIPGLYEIVIEVYDCTTICNDTRRQSFFNSDGDWVGPKLILPGRILIEG